MMLFFKLYSFDNQSNKETFDVEIKRAKYLSIFVWHGVGNYLVKDYFKGTMYLLLDLVFFDGSVAMLITGSVLKFQKSDTITTFSVGIISFLIGIIIRVFEYKDIETYVKNRKKKFNYTSLYKKKYSQKLNSFLPKIEIEENSVFANFYMKF